MLLTNGIIHSPTRPANVPCDAIAIEDGKILAVGSGAALRAQFASIPAIDLGGAHVYPGFLDAHAHIYGMGERITKPRLEGARAKSEVYEILKPLLGASEWIVSRGWNHTLWPEKTFPTRHDLDRHVSTERPIALTRVDGHAMWCNSRALELAGITSTTEAPLGGSIELGADGEPTGILLDEAMKLVERHIPLTSLEENKRTLRAGLAYFAKKGHVGVHEMGVSAPLWEAFCELYRSEGDLLPRAYVFLDMTKPTGNALFRDLAARDLSSLDSWPLSDVHPHLQLVGIKLYLDGALGSRGAHLFEDYSDDPGNRGLALMEDAEVVELFQLAARHKLQIAVHAIGDAANARALRLFRESGVAGSGVAHSGATLRIEHAQIVRDEDVRAFAELGVYALVQPPFYPSDRHWAVERLGPERMRTAYRWRSFLEHGAQLVASSDAPIEDPDPLEGIRLLVGRDGVVDGEALTLPEALRAYCETGWKLSREEKIAGFIQTGMRADLSVVIPGIDGRIDSPNAEILATIVDGKVLYAKEGSPFTS